MINIPGIPIIEKLQAKCRSILVERTYTPGFTISTDQYESLGPFTTVLHISYPAGANKTVSIVQVRTVGSDVCVRDVLLDQIGSASAADYNVSDTHMIYAMLKSVIVGGNTIQCCTPLPGGGFDYTNCPTSNYVRFTVTDTGNIQFLSNPSGAHIWLAPTGQTPADTTQTTPGTITSLPIGNYDYILKLTNYNNYIGPSPITVAKNQTAVVGPIDLIPIEGCIHFKSSPQGARIYLAPVGQTPADTGLNTPNIKCALSLGDYVYKLTLSGYEDATGTVTLVSGHGEIVTKTLRGLPILSDITISPLNPSIAVNTDQQFSATPLDQYGNPYPATVTWNSSNTYVGIIDPNTGMFSALHTGTSVITASSSSVTKTTTVTVTPLVPILHTITISPATVSIVANNAVIFTATKLDQFNNPIFATVTWVSSNPIVGTVDQNGVFLALSQGTTIITASSGTVSGIAVANVTPAVPVEIPVLTTITISPATVSIVANNAVIFTATKLDQFNNPIFATVTWSSSNINIGTIDQNGVFLALSQGTTIITAYSGTVSGIAVANVTPAAPVEIPVLTKITISPLTASLAVGIGTIFVASTLDQFNNPISATVTWNSSDIDVGTINQNGVFLAISPGITTITATSDTISGVAIANVTPAIPSTQPVLTRITISPLTTSLIVGNGTIFTASTLDQFGNSIYATVTWSSNDINVGTIDQNGVFLAISPGITTITAYNGNIVGVAMVNVMPTVPTIQPVLTRITISPLTTTIVVNNSTIFIATTLDQLGDPFSTILEWSSSNTNVGTIDQNGVFAAIYPGTTTIIAHSGTVNGIAIANVTSAVPTTQPILTKITIEPLTTTILVNNSAVFVASTLDQFGNPIVATVAWTSSNPYVGTIDPNTGVFLAISQGTTTIMATSGTVIGVALANVTPTPVVTPVLTTITVLPNTASVMAGNSTVFTVATLDQYGNPISVTVTWSSSDENIGTIDQNGVFLAISPGTTIIRVTSDTISGLAIVNVTPSPVLDKIIVSPSTLSISTNNSAIFTATTLDQFGNPISATVTWSSSNINVGTIEQNGVFTAISPGATTITATSEFISGIAIANVTSLPIILPVLTRIEITPLTTTLTAGSNAVFLASTLDQFGNPISMTVTWTSSDTDIGTITQNGVFTAISPGVTTIMAYSGNISGVAIANVIPVVPTAQPTLANIVITPLTETVLVGTGTVFVVSTLDQFGNSIVTPVTWDSSDPNVGIIDQYGIFSALHIGKTTITATSGTIVGVALVNVVTTLPGQAAGGVLGNINNAALILGMAMVGAVIVAKPHQPTFPTS